MTTQWTGRQRLEALADYLDKTDFAPGKFHMLQWMSSYGVLSNSLEQADPVCEAVKERAKATEPHAEAFERAGDNTYTPIECKTAGCAVGWGAVGIPEFKAQGLKLKHWGYNVAVICYNGRTDFAACREFFEIDNWTVSTLFSPTYYETAERSDPKVVAKRIREHLAST